MLVTHPVLGQQMGHCPAMFVGLTGVLPSQDAVVSIRDLPISMCPQYTCVVCVLLYNNTVIYNILICLCIYIYIYLHSPYADIVFWYHNQ